MTEYTAYLNGEFVPLSECKFHVSDSSIRRGDAVFDAERTFDGKLFRLRDHMERLYRSLNYARIDPGLTLEQMEELALDLLKRNEPLREPGEDFRITQIITRGLGFKVTDKTPATVCVTLVSIDFSVHARFFKTGVHAVFPRTRGYPHQSLDSKFKHISRMNFALADLEAADIDPDSYPILLDTDGNITEGTSVNFFIVKDGVVKTPDDSNLLQGVTRLALEELAGRVGIPYVEETLQPYDAYNADEVFITGTSPVILPVSRIDNRLIGGGEVPGPVTKRLWAAWSEMVGMDFVDQAIRSAEKKGMAV